MQSLIESLYEAKFEGFSPFELSKLELLKQDAIFNNLEKEAKGVTSIGIFGHRYFVKMVDPKKAELPEDPKASDFTYFVGVADRYGRIFLQDADNIYLVNKGTKFNGDSFRQRITKKFDTWHIHKDGEDKQWNCFVVDLNNIPRRIKSMIRQLKND